MCSVRPSSGLEENTPEPPHFDHDSLGHKNDGRICTIVDSSCRVVGTSIGCWLKGDSTLATQDELSLQGLDGGDDPNYTVREMG